MAELKIPNLNNKPKQYLFKNKFNLTRNSKSKLLKESFLMISASILILVINYYIPEKINLLNSFISNINNIYLNFLIFLKYFYQIMLVIFIIFSLLISFTLFSGGIYRLIRVMRRKTKKITFR